MGVYAKAHITVTFDKEPPLELIKVQDLLQKYVGEKNYINAYNVEMYENSLNFDLDSSRSQNLEWQVEQTLQFFRESEYKGILEFSSDAYEQMESACIYMDESDFEEYYEEIK